MHDSIVAYALDEMTAQNPTQSNDIHTISARGGNTTKRPVFDMVIASPNELEQVPQRGCHQGQTWHQIKAPYKKRSDMVGAGPFHPCTMPHPRLAGRIFNTVSLDGLYVEINYNSVSQ